MELSARDGAVAAAPSAPAAASAPPAEQPQEARPAGEKLTPFTYEVAPGDTLSDIAARFGVDEATIIQASGLDHPDQLSIGQKLTILPVAGVLHRVQPGDTLVDIAARYGVTVEDVVRANALAGDTLQVDQELVVPGGKPPVAMAATRDVSARGGGRGSVVSMVWPASGGISTYFGERGGFWPRGHSGIDIAAGWGAPVRAAADGWVAAVRFGGPYGRYIVLNHGDGLQTLYAHLSAAYVDVGEEVGRGQVIGAVGSTGLSTGPHLHFEVVVWGQEVDPLTYLP